MTRLLPDTDSQLIYWTLNEKRKFLPTFTEYLVEVEHQGTHAKQYFIATVSNENDRYTKIIIDTDSDEPTEGNIILTESGFYFYRVYGQNSETNLDPDNTVGLVESGILQVATEKEYFDVPTIVTPNAVVYYDSQS